MSDLVKYIPELVAAYLATCSVMSGSTDLKSTIKKSINTLIANGTIPKVDDKETTAEQIACYTNEEVKRDLLTKDITAKLGIPVLLSALGFTVTLLSLQQSGEPIPTEALWIGTINIVLIILILTLTPTIKDFSAKAIRFGIMLPVFALTIGLNIYFKGIGS